MRNKNMRRKSDTPIKEKRAPDIMPPLAPDVIRIVPLGGTEEVGRNMTAIEYGDDIIVVDCGIQFTDAETPGVDYILPNTSLSRGAQGQDPRPCHHPRPPRPHRRHPLPHGPHWQSAYLYPRVRRPAYQEAPGGVPSFAASRYPHRRSLDKSIPITPNLKVRFFGLTHSIPDSTGIIIETPFGDIVNTGDVRVDNENGVPAEKEVEQYKMFKDRNTLLFTMDSTGIEKPASPLLKPHP
jgi:ribonuclease J